MPKKCEHSTTDITRVSFRLDQDLATELARRAAETNRSHSLEAKSLVSSALTAQDDLSHEITMLRAHLAELREELLERLETLRSDLLTIVPILLSKAGRLTPDQARQWVRQTLLDQ
jgi:hypothetical protein